MSGIPFTNLDDKASKVLDDVQEAALQAKVVGACAERLIRDCEPIRAHVEAITGDLRAIVGIFRRAVERAEPGGDR